MDNIDKMDNPEGEACMIARTPLPAVTVVAMAYVPFQQFGTIYDPEKGLRSGTLFPDLDKPFLGGRGVLK
ncbi:spore coat associated protein CotJA [Caproiciproducens galactitolivorans]|uniref:Spore coat associated protein CotJA n=1 Tax=Caproiciproducens galactitolivorans TaxID=642589 RepID=A0ABT4BWW3_9FIRM|nr:spore coat associated protein CotJA [Caproiciproducens galactitolivorans]MCY1714433.1 spore coat associated protein CotJA [Caproiciproducens galactitolivorans]